MAEAKPTHDRDLAHADRDDFDDNPEATDEELRQFRPFAEVFPEMAAKIRGSAPKPPAKA